MTTAAVRSELPERRKWRWLFTAFMAALCGALLAVLITFISSMRSYRIQQALAGGYVEDAMLAQRLRFQLEERVAVERGYLLTGNEEFRREFSRSGSKIALTIAELKRRLPSLEWRALLEEIEAAEARPLDEHLAEIAADRRSAASRGRSPGGGRSLFDREPGTRHGALIWPMNNLLDRKLDAFKTASVRAERTGYLGLLFSGAAGLCGIAAILAAGLFIRRSLLRIEESEKNLEKANADLEHLVALRTKRLEDVIADLRVFGYSVVHDLRGPARAVAAFSEIVLNKGDRLDEESRGHLRRIRDAGQRLRLMLDGLLTLNQLSQETPSFEKADLGVLAQKILAEMAAREKGRRADLRIAGKLEAKGDVRLLQVLMRSLLENAWKFAGKGETARIEIGTATLGGEKAYFVRDNGIGFDPAYASQLFRPFCRLPNADGFPGLGIGLAAAARVVSAHGGRIWAEGSPGLGAAFFFTLGQAP